MTALHPRVSAPFKHRHPVGIWLLMLVTLGIYFFIWYYQVNQELAEAGRKVSPAGAVVAVTLGSLLIVPPFVSIYNTGRRIARTREETGLSDSPSGGVGVLLYIVLVFVMPYYQSSLNGLAGIPSEKSW